MKILGLNIGRSRPPADSTAVQKAITDSLSPVDGRGGWWTLIKESFTGAWQQNVEVNQDTVAAYWAVFSCVTLIAGDISKLPLNIMQRGARGVWEKTKLRPVLQRPNHFQTRAEFIASWLFSRLLTGNTYVLKQRNSDGFITGLYVLDPRRVTPLVAPDSTVYYQLMTDDLSQVTEPVVAAPASEIIHDKMYTLYHPLVGISPIYACGVPAMMGSAIQSNSAKLFQNMSRPSGILTAPGSIHKDTAARLKESWDTNYSAGNFGKVAVLGDGLKYEQLTVTAADAQLIEQLKMTAEMVCACYHVPGYKIGVGTMPSANNTASLNQQYYDQCLQFIIETMELRLDEGLELPRAGNFETWFDVNALVRMDPDTRFKAHSEAIRGGWKSPNEARNEEDYLSVDGGDTPYMQQQNYSLASLAARDQRALEDDGAGDVQAQAMNGAQVTSLQGLISAAARAEIPKETARATIAAAFPLLSAAQINAIINPLPDALTPALVAASIVEVDEVKDDEDEVASFMAALVKGFSEPAHV